MKFTQFKSDYPVIAGLLPQKFMTGADDDNTLRRAIEQDRTEYLSLLNTLAQQSPAETIRKDPNRLMSRTNFQSFYSEMKAHIALKHWVFAPSPADIKGTEGEPDYEFNVGHLDIEVASRTAWDKKDNVRVALEEKLNDTPYTAIITLRDDFIKIPYTGADIDHNEQLVDDIIDQIEQLDVSNPPNSIKNNGFRIQFKQTGGGGAIIRWGSAEQIPRDPDGRIVDQLRDKVKKQRGGRPLLLFYDANVSFLESKDMRALLHGAPSSGPQKEVSDRVYQHRAVWGDYLRNQGYIPDSGTTTYMKQVEPDNSKYDLKHVGDSCICKGDEGIFSDRTFDRVAGVLFIDKPGNGHFIPNFYSEKMNFHSVYETIAQNMEIKSTNFNDLL
ncbi:hypothetical protein [Haloarcula argentinensis]|uniref:Uncharacterized protein n=1 Tax=Haloarcula argentinensis TaxID=43776 RepID=A0A830FSF1_HALAR|nr:hypothetical protein [Haloarcula argentinensis]GGM53175.1 hypothetical protein GCM10009006_37860 [Haloarcula argentinensis]